MIEYFEDTHCFPTCVDERSGHEAAGEVAQFFTDSCVDRLGIFRVIPTPRSTGAKYFTCDTLIIADTKRFAFDAQRAQFRRAAVWIAAQHSYAVAGLTQLANERLSNEAGTADDQNG